MTCATRPFNSGLFDTSFLAQLILQEATSEKIEAFFAKLPAGQLYVSQWTRVEFASLGVVAKYLNLAADAGLGWPLPDDLDDGALERRLYRQPTARASAFTEPDYARVHQELKRKGVTLILLWEEYRL